MDISTPILRVLRERALYGYEIIRLLRETTPGLPTGGEGMIYPVLQMLEHRKLVCAKWQLSAKGRRRRYYSLTSKGQKRISHKVPAD